MGIWTQQKVNCREKVSRAMMILIIIWLFVEFAKIKNKSLLQKHFQKRKKCVHDMVKATEEFCNLTWIWGKTISLSTIVISQTVKCSSLSCNYFYTHQASGFLWLGLFILPLGCFLCMESEMKERSREFPIYSVSTRRLLSFI